MKGVKRLGLMALFVTVFSANSAHNTMADQRVKASASSNRTAAKMCLYTSALFKAVVAKR